MDFLFLHENYPGQFVHLATALASNSANRVVFITNRHDYHYWPLNGVEVRLFKIHRPPSSQTHAYVKHLESSVLRGQSILSSIEQLLKDGYNPRFVVYHGGQGFGLFLKDILPSSVAINYAEWWFTHNTSRFLVENYSFNQRLSSGMHNTTMLLELDRCDVAVTPTQWQYSQFPEQYQSKIKIIFDGIDTRIYFPRRICGPLSLQGDEMDEALVIKPSNLVVSYATRGMEPLRGFPQFMRMIPDLLSHHSNLIVVIAGRDRVAYSYPSPAKNGSWKDWLMREIEGKCDTSRIHFTGILNMGELRNLLWRTNLHVYFSGPYVTSWGLFQAAACGSPMLVNIDPCIDYVIGKNAAKHVLLEDNSSHVTKALSILDDSFQNNYQCRSHLHSDFTLASGLTLWSRLLADFS